MSGPAVISAEDPAAASAACRVLARGGLIAFPTETVYGLGAADRPEAIARLAHAKGRDRARPFQKIAADIDAAGRAAPAWPRAADKLARRFWPGPLTLVVEKDPGGPSVGLRVPDHPVPVEIARRAGGLIIATSANASGSPEPLEACDVLRELGARVSVVLDGGPVAGGVPSTVVRVCGDEVSILREGALPAAEVIAAAK